VSGLEEGFLRLWASLDASRGLPAPVQQHYFHPTRKWRFDFAWPDIRLAVELHGGIWRKKGAHNTGKAIHRDCEKSRAATKLGWTVLAYTTKDMEERPVQVIEEVAEVLRMRGSHAD